VAGLAGCRVFRTDSPAVRWVMILGPEEYRRGLAGSHIALEVDDWRSHCRITASASLTRNTWVVRRNCRMQAGHLCRPVLRHDRTPPLRFGAHQHQYLLHGYALSYVLCTQVEIPSKTAPDMVVQEGVEVVLLFEGSYEGHDFVQVDNCYPN
jgi:hypothetical protein